MVIPGEDGIGEPIFINVASDRRLSILKLSITAFHDLERCVCGAFTHCGADALNAFTDSWPMQLWHGHHQPPCASLDDLPAQYVSSSTVGLTDATEIDRRKPKRFLKNDQRLTQTEQGLNNVSSGSIGSG